MPGLVNLCSPEGQAILNKCRTSSSTFQPFLVGLFRKQIGMSNCGITSAAQVMAANKIGKDRSLPSKDDVDFVIPLAEQPIIEENMFKCDATTKVKSQEAVDKEGTTLEEMCSVIRGFGYSAKQVYATDVNVEIFRKDAVQALSNANSCQGVIVNYCMTTLGQDQPFGHHSPLAGYDEESDRFLIMDTWTKTKECWAKAEDLYNAMNTIDNDSGKSRGYCIVSD